MLGYAIAATGRWALTATILTIVALAVGMNVGGSGIDLVALYSLALFVNLAGAFWASGVAMRLAHGAGGAGDAAAGVPRALLRARLRAALAPERLAARRGERQPDDVPARGRAEPDLGLAGARLGRVPGRDRARDAALGLVVARPARAPNAPASSPNRGTCSGRAASRSAASPASRTRARRATCTGLACRRYVRPANVQLLCSRNRARIGQTLRTLRPCRYTWRLKKCTLDGFSQRSSRRSRHAGAGARGEQRRLLRSPDEHDRHAEARRGRVPPAVGGGAGDRRCADREGRARGG